MKKLIAIFMAIALCACLFVGCQSPDVEISKEYLDSSMFVIIESTCGTNGWIIVYHKETRVMYAVSQGYYNFGNFTVMLNPDGSPMVWEGN